jgi:hypothetical protein
MYSFEAEAGTGVDRLKLILLSKRVEFPTIAKSKWNIRDDGEASRVGVPARWAGCVGLDHGGDRIAYSPVSV